MSCSHMSYGWNWISREILRIEGEKLLHVWFAAYNWVSNARPKNWKALYFLNWPPYACGAFTWGSSINSIALISFSKLKWLTGIGAGPTPFSCTRSPQKGWSPKKGTIVVGHCRQTECKKITNLFHVTWIFISSVLQYRHYITYMVNICMWILYQTLHSM